MYYTESTAGMRHGRPISRGFNLSTRGIANGTALSPEQLKEEFVRRRKLHYILIAAVVVLGLCVMFLGNDEAEVTVVILVLLAGYTVFHIRTWRCPVCDKFLGKKLNSSLCAKCGSQLK